MTAGGRTLILFAHPALEKSRVHRRLVQHVPNLPGLTFHDLYEAYPAFDIDVQREQALLEAHDLVVLQHPLYWYSAPALVKQWEDLVLEHGWAYGSNGTALRGKRWLNVITAGGAEPAYRHEGHNRHTLGELLAPIAQSVRLCGMRYLPPYVVFGTHWMTDADLERAAADYGRAVTRLHREPLDDDVLERHPTLNAALAAIGEADR